VVISAPAKDLPAGQAGGESAVHGETILLSVNEDKFGTCKVTSNASCTTNASSPVIAILDEAIGIEKAILNTVHSYTASQGIVDGPNKKDFREGRAAAQNIVPSSTGAAIAVTKAFTSLTGLFDGISIRVPTPAGSIADITFIAKRTTTVEEVNNILKQAATTDRWKHVFQATEEELVSSDILGLPYASIADLKMTRVVGGNLVKVIDADDELGSVADISVYNGNLYFLAPTKNKIYKYVPTENGFSEKSVYTKSESSVLRQTSSIAIDSSVYAASTDTILKYTAGVEDEFKTVFPEEGVHIYKVITNADLEKVYAWDRANGVLYILAKNGTYERQVRSSSFAKADDVAVFGNTAYTLENKKIYSISIE
jgi:hypothetical protein